MNKCMYVEKGVRTVFYNHNNQTYVYAKPCCMMTYDQIPKEYSKPFKLESIKDLMSLEPLVYYRKYFDTHTQLPPACEICINHESKNLQSPRLNINQVDFTDYDINRLDILIGRSCNLACAFCSSESSSLIDKLARTHNAENLPVSWKPISDSFWPVSENTSNIVAEILKNYKVHTIKIIGGEPFLKENWNNIFKIIDDGYTKDTNFIITTNGTVLNNNILLNLQKNNHTHLSISVDSIGKNYEFIRWPHSWKKIDKRLKYLRDNTFENIHFNISVLINIFNFEFLPEIEKYLSEITPNVKYTVNITPFTHLMNYKNLPSHIIDYVSDNLISKDLKKILVNTHTPAAKEKIQREFKVLLAQRNMKAYEVIGPMTREYFEL